MPQLCQFFPPVNKQLKLRDVQEFFRCHSASQEEPSKTMALNSFSIHLKILDEGMMALCIPYVCVWLWVCLYVCLCCLYLCMCLCLCFSLSLLSLWSICADVSTFLCGEAREWHQVSSSIAHYFIPYRQGLSFDLKLWLWLGQQVTPILLSPPLPSTGVTGLRKQAWFLPRC